MEKKAPLTNESEFLREKLALFVQHIKSSDIAKVAAQMFGDPIEELARAKTPDRTRLKRLEQSIESLLAGFVSKADRANIDRRLREQFGYDWIGESPRSVIERVLKTGRISSERDFEIVSEVISHTENEQRIGQSKYRRLGGLVDAYGG